MNDIRYTRTPDGTHVAYEVTGGGALDIVLLRAWHTDIEHEWNEPVLARLMRRLGSIGRLIRFDRRGMGLSDRPGRGRPLTIDERLDDLRAVLDAVGSRSALLVGIADGATLLAVYAATHPDRTSGLVMWEPSPRWRWAPDYPWGDTEDQLSAFLDALRTGWATRELAARVIAEGAPSRASDERLIRWLTEHQNRSGTAADAVSLAELQYQTDITATLSSIRVPTLVLARSPTGVGQARYVADRIAGARLVVLPGNDHFAISGDTDALIDQIEAFGMSLAANGPSRSDRVLATLVFTDVIASTERAVQLGDRRWAMLLEDHHRRSKELVERHRGRLVDTAGDGIFAAFDAASRAIGCARALVDDAQQIGIELRAGVHTGECEMLDDRVRGVAVHIGARVAALAGRSEVLVTGTVKDLVAGSGYEFTPRGEHELRGVPGAWRLFAVG